MKVLIACEFSGIVRDAFAAKGHDAWSCDLLPCERGGNHIQSDVLSILNDEWDLMIAHPPCTHLAVSGARWFKTKQVEQRKAIWFFLELARCSIPKTCTENPISIISSRIRKPDQIIQPWQFGHPESKATCLWLKGLPTLEPTDVCTPPEYRPNGRPKWANQTRSGQNKLPPSAGRAKERGRTYAGIAEAMASQWGTVSKKTA